MSAARPGGAAPWHALDRGAVEAALGTGPRGLPEAEAEARLARYGPNRLEEAPPPSPAAILLHQFASPLIYVLVAATLVTFVLAKYIDMAVIGVVLAMNALIGFVQEHRAERSVRALMALVSPRARVIRDGREWEVASESLVPGDLVLLETGVRVPADLRLVGTTALAVDESLLTGESVPVAKRSGPVDAAAAVADRTNMAHAGSVVSSGRGQGYVVATAAATELGGIAAHLRSQARARTPMQHRMDRLARVVAGAVAVSAVLAFALGVALGESAADMFLVAVGLTVASVPEGLPVVFTITMALGVRRMAARRTIIRRLPAVETLGSTTVIGSDKTGTLTENRMTVEEVWAGGRVFFPGRNGLRAIPTALARPLYLATLTGVLTNEADIYRTEAGYQTTGDPTDAALLVAAARLGVEPEVARAAYPTYAEIPFEPERRYSASIRLHDGAHEAFVKGAPERVLGMCRSMLGADGPVALDRDAVLAAMAGMAARGLRVLALAHRTLDTTPPGPEDLPEPDALTLVGLVGLMDPPRAGVREAIAGCREAGIRVVMITGDHADTAAAIGRRLGLVDEGARVVTGADLDALDEAALDRAVRETTVYARVAPEHKLRVVRAFQRQGEVVAVTGDGVNDAPALKAADIGVAMGKSGTDVAREAADMVLADDDFVSIYGAVEEGRVTFDNVRKVTFFLVSTGAAAVLTILTTLVMGWPLPFLPAQLLWLNLVTNGLQDVALAFEPGDPDVLRRPPRPRGEGIISPRLWWQTAVAGVVMAAGTLALFHWELSTSGSLARAQTTALTTMVLFQMFHVGNARSELGSVLARSPLSNPFLFLATAAALLVHVGALYLGPTQFVLRVEPITMDAWLRIVPAAATIVLAMEALKRVQRGRSRVGAA